MRYLRSPNRPGWTVASSGVVSRQRPGCFHRLPNDDCVTDLAAVGSLEFSAPDDERFPAIPLARAALMAGRGTTVILNAANEIAVESFLDARIGFLDIAETVARVLDRVEGFEIASLEDFRSLDRESREIAKNLVKSDS